MDRFHSMQLFTRIVELGSFTKAADDLLLPRHGDARRAAA
jgi:DNA-binding transcriptional LysR family regulator